MPVITTCFQGGASDGRPGWRFALAYNEDAIERLKQTVPSAEREWLPSPCEWWVSDEWAETLRRLFPQTALFMDQPRLPL